MFYIDNNSLFAVLVIGLFMSCNKNYSETLVISDVQKQTSKEIRFDLNENDFVDKLKITVEGYINDTAKINQYYLLPGEIDTTFKGDWYSSGCIIDYLPIKADSGYLKLEFEFVVY